MIQNQSFRIISTSSSLWNKTGKNVKLMIFCDLKSILAFKDFVNKILEQVTLLHIASVSPFIK